MPALRALALFLALAAPAHADLYRWVDRESGSVKFSSVPPADPSVNAEVLPYRGPAPAATLPSAAPGATAPAAAPVAEPSVSALEARLRELFAQLTGATPSDFDRAGDALRERLAAYETVRAELDKLDPAGATRRQAEDKSLIERLRQGFAAGMSPTPPSQK